MNIKFFVQKIIYKLYFFYAVLFTKRNNHTDGEINIFVPSIQFADAVSDDALCMRDALIALGYKCTIFTEKISDPLFPHIFSYRGSEKNILIIHHSFYTNVFDCLIKLKDKKILRYHNITEERFAYSDNDLLFKIRLARTQLAKFKGYINYAWPDSKFNSIDLHDLGYLNISVLPILIDFQRYTKLEKKVDDVFSIVYLSKFFEHKHQLNAVIMIRAFLDKYKVKTRLYLVGDHDWRHEYYLKVKEFIESNSMTDNVVITGKISFEELSRIEALADCAVSFSEHEGFSVPLLEAMYFGVPIVAKNNTATPETLGGAGILYEKFEEVPDLLYKIYSDNDYRKSVVEAQNRRLKELYPGEGTAKLKELIGKL